MAAPPSPDVSGILLALCGTLSAPGGWQADVPEECDWDALTRWAQAHGLAGALPSKELVASGRVPEAVVAAWRRLAVEQFARNAALYRRLDEAAVALAAAGIPAILFKGAAAMEWVYENRACRHLGDLDLLISAPHVEAARARLRELGYAEASAYTSPEEERLGIEQVHLPPFVHPDGTVIELHVNVLERRGDRAAATPELWRDAVRPGDGPLLRLSWSHFLLQTAVHYTRHLEEDFAPLKGLADVAAVLRRCGPELDWPELWRTARRWDVELAAARVLATAAAEWHLEVPGLPPGIPRIPREALVLGSCPDPGGPALRGLDRVRSLSELPDLPSRCRYLLRLLFPTPEHLRWRYRLPEGASVAPYYARYPFERAWQLLRGRPGGRSERK